MMPEATTFAVDPLGYNGANLVYCIVWRSELGVGGRSRRMLRQAAVISRGHQSYE